MKKEYKKIVTDIDKYNKIVNKILNNPKLQVHEKLIRILDKASKYEVVSNK